MVDLDWDSVRQQYIKEMPIFLRVKEEALFIINQALNETNIKILYFPSYSS